jgi:hypothetical protein
MEGSIVMRVGEQTRGASASNVWGPRSDEGNSQRTENKSSHFPANGQPVSKIMKLDAVYACQLQETPCEVERCECGI